jgi:hypothetical protein
MAVQKKVSPEGAPPALEPVGLGGADAPRVSMMIDGGNRGEEYSFHFEASAGGALRLLFKSDLSGLYFDDSRGRMESVEFDRLLRRVNVSRLKQARRRRMPPIPPCSLLGCLEVFDGKERVQVVFMADEGQAKQAGYRMPPIVARTRETIYGLAAKQLGLREAKALRP